jgi:hypothetical protein
VRALTEDPDLTARQRLALIEIYRAFVAENETGRTRSRRRAPSPRRQGGK